MSQKDSELRDNALRLSKFPSGRVHSPDYYDTVETLKQESLSVTTESVLIPEAVANQGTGSLARTMVLVWQVRILEV